MTNLNQPPGVVIHGDDGNEWTRCPECLTSSPLDHDVTRHDDGTVTVAPSVMCGCGAHFMIERSVVRLV